MQFYATGVFLATLAAAYLFQCLFSRERRRRLVREQGCEPIPRYPCVEPLGRDYDRIVTNSFKDGRVNKTAMEQYEKVGASTYEVHTVNERVIHTREPANYQAIATKQEDWGKGKRRAALPFFGTNILEQQGAAWRHARNMINPLFQRAELKDVEFFRKYVDRMIDLIPRDKSTVDMQPLLRKLFLDTSSEFIFGESINSLTSTTKEPDEFIAAFNRATAGAGKRIRPTGLLLKLYGLGTWDKDWLADIKVVHDYVDGCIARYRSRNPSSLTPSEFPPERKRYVLIEGMSASIPDPIDLRFQLLGIFAIARETVAMGFANVLFVLARHPAAWQALRAHALALEPAVLDHLTPQAAIYHDDHLRPFRNAILEAFRLHSPITRLRRLALRDTVLPKGGGPDGSAPAFVAKGTAIWADTFPNTRDPEIWGEDVEDFRPERFEGRRLGWDFNPFSGGPRKCPATQQVMSQCVYLLVRLVREFEAIENRDPCEEYIEGVLMCFESRNGCQVALHPAA